MPAGFGTDSNLRSSMFGCANQTQIRIENCLRNRYSNYMKMKGRGNIAEGFWKWSKGHSFTPLVFTSTGGIADECKRFHSRPAELLLALNKGDDNATAISWITAEVSFAILRSALLCLRGTRSNRRAVNVSDFGNSSESAQARI